MEEQPTPIEQTKPIDERTVEQLIPIDELTDEQVAIRLAAAETASACWRRATSTTTMATWTRSG